jgi:hypothetical protein
VAWPASASAKEVQKAQVCGASECFTFDRANSGGKLALFDGGGNPALPPAHAAPWYRLRIMVGGPDIERFTFTDAYVPSADASAIAPREAGTQWVEVIDDLKPVLRNVSSELRPLSASSLRGLEAGAAPAPPAARDTGARSGAGSRSRRAPPAPCSRWSVALRAGGSARAGGCEPTSSGRRRRTAGIEGGADCRGGAASTPVRHSFSRGDRR